MAVWIRCSNTVEMNKLSGLISSPLCSNRNMGTLQDTQIDPSANKTNLLPACPQEETNQTAKEFGLVGQEPWWSKEYFPFSCSLVYNIFYQYQEINCVQNPRCNFYQLQLSNSIKKGSEMTFLFCKQLVNVLLCSSHPRFAQPPTDWFYNLFKFSFSEFFLCVTHRSHMFGIIAKSNYSTVFSMHHRHSVTY